MTAAPSSDAAAIAHLLRRTGFGPAPGETEGYATFDEALRSVLESAVDDGAEMPDPSDDDLEPSLLWWLRRMRRTTAPLHEKMVLFWHSHITSSADKASADMMARQHNLIRRHALGNFRSLVDALVHDAALLVYLDAASSRADEPNENLARELMELFMLGRGAFTEADVKGAAVALAGMRVEWDSEAVGFDEDAGASGPVTVLGVTADLDATGLIDVICDHPACAPFVAGRLYRFLVGTDPDDARRAELAKEFTATGLEIRPLVEAILRGPEFVERRWARARLPLEWWVAAHHAFGLDVTTDSMWELYDLGQVPMYPPNVAGWPIGPQWLGAGRQLQKAALALVRASTGMYIDLGTVGHEERAAAALARCGVYEASPSTFDALTRAAGRIGADDGGDLLLTALALASPEAACA